MDPTWAHYLRLRRRTSPVTRPREEPVWAMVSLELLAAEEGDRWERAEEGDRWERAEGGC